MDAPEEILRSDDSAASVSGEKCPAIVLMLVDKAPDYPGNLLLSLLLRSSSLEATHNNPSDTNSAAHLTADRADVSLRWKK